MSKKKVILTAAVTGAVHVPSMTPYLPITPEQIINEALRAREAGAAVVHIHARDPQTGQPSSDVGLMQEIVKGIKERSDVAICITTGGAIGMSIEERLKAIPTLKPELASCNAGSVNFVFSPIADKLPNPKFEWEIPFLRNTYDLVFSNTFKSLEDYISTMNQHGTLPEFEVYDVGMINNIAYFRNNGIIKQPIYLQFVLGVLGGMPATIENLMFLVKSAREQLGDVSWSCAAAGKQSLPIAAVALALGGNVRVGLEDNIYLKPGVLAKSSAEQVKQVRTIAETLHYEIASPDEARAILSLKGSQNVNF